jgi:hypothetical protein
MNYGTWEGHVCSAAIKRHQFPGNNNFFYISYGVMGSLNVVLETELRQQYSQIIKGCPMYTR